MMSWGVTVVGDEGLRVAVMTANEEWMIGRKIKILKLKIRIVLEIWVHLWRVVELRWCLSGGSLPLGYVKSSRQLATPGSGPTDVVITPQIASCIDDKCSACNAVAEKPRNHLDMRHRLDSKGQRKGKFLTTASCAIAESRVSELRVVELLDGLCEKMQDYTLTKIDSTKQEWIKVDDWDNLSTSTLLEEIEDEFAELIKKGSVKVGEVSEVICQDLSKHCQTSGYHHTGGAEDETDKEL
ncbi:hypothetical protein TEA_022920 [Camellia sinensis var. sinensis]|uniref:DUF3456 domain-containing protein n=1 Tax=Camellia sinensis var. sinensis TaxID=542762 RepID=A0A4S4DW41_CAMSN|nr:hypothetical protein TEA_022920 [Camellia sinensis var. sinensis]